MTLGMKDMGNAEKSLFNKKFLKQLDLQEEEMNRVLEHCTWRKNLSHLVESGDFHAASLLEILKPAMAFFAEEPSEGWLQFISDSIRASLYPENFHANNDNNLIKARIFFMQNYRILLQYEEETCGFSPTDHLEFLNAEETKECVIFEEYENFKNFWKKNYIFEFMRLNREITQYNTAGHICGVHYVAVCMGRQFAGTGIPIDIALLSGAAAGHDLGKFGCSAKEASRVPYLHYYYTDELLKKEKMPMIGHIASNHSTWDLELENLSIESILLIYSDFRVKSETVSGVETVDFHTLDEAFDIILNKLDNVDDAKRLRYRKVYAKLKDFENYMISIGISTDVLAEPKAKAEVQQKDTSLLMGEEVVEGLKHMAIGHNVRVMSIFNNETAFGSLIEAARSERQWKSQRTYLNIFSEYHTYMTKQEKLMTLYFLYELLSHREGDIRRQAGKLLGTIVAGFDDIYRKELPEYVKTEGAKEAFEIWQIFLDKIVFPDHKVTDQHRSWIGYTLKTVLQGIIENTDKDTCRMFMTGYFAMLKSNSIENSGVFVVLDSLLTIPSEIFEQDDMESAIKFAADVSVRESTEIRIGALRVSEYIAGNLINEVVSSCISEILRNSDSVTENVSVAYLAYKVCGLIGDEKRKAAYYERFTNYKQANEGDENDISIIFRENLKMGTPWVVKIVNIDFLLEQALSGNLDNQKFHLATHLSNLIKVSERVTVRHRAGRGLIDIAKTLPIEQLNEIVIELTKGLEIGEYQFSKYIPEYLGALALQLCPEEFDELIENLRDLLENMNDHVGSVTLDTVGEILEHYADYKYRREESEDEYENRKIRMLGMLLKGFVNHQETVSQEAFMVIGQHIFGSGVLKEEEKFDAFRYLYKKLLTLIVSCRNYDMNFFTNAAALNHIYRFISEYYFSKGKMELSEINKIAFFPGTFDPFSLSHKGIVQAVKNLGFEVYLALDEFSWSKKTQPRMIRRKIANISVADEGDVYMFPDDFPVNIANPEDLKNLKEIFPGKEIYIVAGSDVIINASSYSDDPVENSIHSMNHIVFKRETAESGTDDISALNAAYRRITGRVIKLTLPVQLEDISSTSIRENIDNSRDISNLIDPAVQNYIYDNGLYLREPQYKNIFETKSVFCEELDSPQDLCLKPVIRELNEKGISTGRLERYLGRADVNVSVIKDGENRVCAFAAMNRLETGNLYDAFRDIEVAAYLRKKTTGHMLVIRELFSRNIPEIINLDQVIMTEVLAEAVAADITYAIFAPLGKRIDHKVRDVLLRQGFTEIKIGGKPQGIYEVNMKEPIAVIKNMDTVLKAPFNSNPRILSILEQTHEELQLTLTRLNPGNLVLSFDAGIMHQKIVDMVTATNNVPNRTMKKRSLGECMCVPFGKILMGKTVPNTVTKALHTEKVFTSKLDNFTIEEYPMYTTIQNQIKTIKSFGRPVILVDDLLHKGYRIKALDPIFKDNDVEIRKIITGLLSGRGRDLMEVQDREVESAYFIPNLKYWFVESTMYPYIGGDGIQSENKTEYNLINSINLILPFVAPVFLRNAAEGGVYELSEVCIKNAGKIFTVLEEEYQKTYEKQLTIKRLSDTIISPRMPNGAAKVFVDVNLSPSVYMEDYLERLIRIESALR